MVRTRADNTARKAVAAKAPRKNVGSSSSSSRTAMASPKAGGKYAGGNIACPRPVPDWQKGITTFFPKSPRAPGKENETPDDDSDIVQLGESSGAGCSSSQGSSFCGGSSNQEQTTPDSDDDD